MDTHPHHPRTFSRSALWTRLRSKSSSLVSSSIRLRSGTRSAIAGELFNFNEPFDGPVQIFWFPFLAMSTKPVGAAAAAAAAEGDTTEALGIPPELVGVM
jgi:hypothetical protein